MRLLLVDDDLAELLRATGEALEFETEKVGTAAEAAERIAVADPETVVVCAPVLERLLALERDERRRFEDAYRETVAMLASALESKDPTLRAHAHRVQQYALRIAEAVDPDLAQDTSVQYGFLLHDIGTMRVPDKILFKPGPLSRAESRLLQSHPVVGEQMLRRVAFLRGEGLKVVRSHHERWDGHGYPDRLEAERIPLAARIFAVADALDAMTSDRPYRRAGRWDAALTKIDSQAGAQFDPRVVEAFIEREPELRAIRSELSA